MSLSVKIEKTSAMIPNGQHRKTDKILKPKYESIWAISSADACTAELANVSDNQNKTKEGDPVEQSSQNEDLIGNDKRKWYKKNVMIGTATYILGIVSVLIWRNFFK